MTKSEHERERRAFWDACCAATAMLTDQESPFSSAEHEASWCAELATAKLAERDKVFPEPSDGAGLSIDGEPGPDDPVLCNTCVSRDDSAMTEPCLGCCGEYVLTGRRKNWRHR